MKLILAFVFSVSFATFAQTETGFWRAKKFEYSCGDVKESFSYKKSGPENLFKKIYKRVISDYDGDNCPFEPSCSSFFVEAVKLTNIFQGCAMFADRFTRDLNYFNRTNYRRTENGKLFDPPEKYLLR